MINKRQYQVTSNKPILHKKGKQWIVISLSALALAMGVGVGSTVTTHASQVSANAPATKQVQKAPVAKLATNLHNQLVGNGASTTPKSVGSVSNNSAASKPVTPSSAVSQSGSSVVNGSSAQSSSVSQNQSSNTPVQFRGFGAERTLGATQNNTATDYINYVNDNKVVGVGYKESGKTTDFDSDALNYTSDFTKKKYDNLPAGYQISSATYNKYNNDFSLMTGTNFGDIQYNIPVSDVSNTNTSNKPKAKTNTNNTSQTQMGKIDAEFVEVQPNGSYKVLTPTPSSDASDESLHLDGNIISDTGVVGQTHDVDDVAYDFDTILSPFMPKGFSANQITDPNAHGQYDLYDRILNKQGLHFESDGFGDQALEYMANPKTIYIGLKPDNEVTVTVHYVDENGKTIASDDSYDGVPNDNFQFNFKTIPNYSIDYSKLGQDNLITNAKYPNHNWVTTLVYKSTKPTPPAPKPNKKPVKPQAQKASDYVLYTYNNKQVGKTAFHSDGTTTTNDTGIYNFAHNFSNALVNNNMNGLYKNNGLPQAYKLSKQTFSDYGSDFFTIASDIKQKNPSTYGSIQYRIPVIARPKGTITIDYVNNGKVISSVKDNDQKATNFDIGNYLDVPNGYEYQGIKNDVDHFDYNNHTVDVLVNKVNPAKVAKSNITVNYVSNGKVISSTKVNEPVSTNFDVGDYLDNLPSGYEYQGLKNDTDHFTYNDQTVDVLLNKVNPAKVAQSTITVKLVDKATGQYKKVGSDTENITTPFDIGHYLSNLPAGYEYAGIKSDVDSFDYNNHTVEILLNKVAQPRVAKSTITVNYVNNGKVVSSTKDTQPVSTDFDISNYLDVPSGYEYSGIKNSIDHFGYNNHTVDVLVNKVAPVKTSIFINYRDKKSGMIVKSTKITEPVGTNFDTGEYLSNIPSNYEYAGLRGTTDNFGYDNQTVDIYMTKEPDRKPVQPSSAAKPKSKAQPAKPSSAKPSSSSKAPSASAKPSSKSSSAVKPAKPSSAKSNPSSAAKKPSASVKPSSVPSTSSKAPSKASSAKSKSATKPSSAVKPSNNSKAQSASAKPSVVPSSTPSTAPSYVAPSVAPSSATPSVEPSNTPRRPTIVPPASSKAPTPSEKARPSSKTRHTISSSAKPTNPVQSTSNKSGVAKHNEAVIGSKANNQSNYANHSLANSRDANNINNTKVAPKSNSNHPVYVNGHKLPQTSEAKTHVGVISLILFALAGALFTLGKKSERHNK